jgi:hypothetical protein
LMTYPALANEHKTSIPDTLSGSGTANVISAHNVTVIYDRMKMN